MMKLSPWTLTEDGCGAFRYIEGRDPNDILNRVAFIEKTPRIRIRNYRDYYPFDDWVNWAEGPKGDGPEDQDSRNWCDKALELFYDI